MNKALQIKHKLLTKDYEDIRTICGRAMLDILSFCSQQLEALNKKFEDVQTRYEKSFWEMEKILLAEEMHCLRLQLAIINGILDLIESRNEDA